MEAEIINKLKHMLGSKDVEMLNLAACIIDADRNRYITFTFLSDDARRSYYKGVLAHIAWDLETKSPSYGSDSQTQLDYGADQQADALPQQ